ncbi:hypothetical protein [Pseudooceanicola sp. HF7]|uniref:hypothetical protein n=1 Tax=Pseudooceanicola sp. HF7 TaxID=2721560 RepID=UPI001431A265|nr:hypothetical protein [Pseudooceanicola sp. HF7]NIZ09291.1 hypothetical protein [Pseudooceanicola sp. HF7]
MSPALLGGGMNPVVTGTDALWGLPLLSASGAVIVPKLAGWDRCGAVIWTARRALSMNVPVYLVDDTGEA